MFWARFDSPLGATGPNARGMKALVRNAVGRGFELEDVDLAAPSGREVTHRGSGVQYSGVGREYAGYGIEAFLETKAILE